MQFKVNDNKKKTFFFYDVNGCPLNKPKIYFDSIKKSRDSCAGCKHYRPQLLGIACYEKETKTSFMGVVKARELVLFEEWANE